MDIKTGDEIRVFIHRYRRDDDYRAMVTKVGRKYGTAVYESVRSDHRGDEVRVECSIEFDLETGKERNGREVGAGGSRVLTLEEVALKERREAAGATLLRAGISFYSNAGYNLTVEQMEALAAVAADFPEYDRSR
jgi:hypothetical protein